MLDLITALFKDAWKSQAERCEQIRIQAQKSLVALNSDIKKLVDRIIKTESETVVNAVEQRLEGLEEQKLRTQEAAQKKLTLSVGQKGKYRTHNAIPIKPLLYMEK